MTGKRDWRGVKWEAFYVFRDGAEGLNDSREPMKGPLPRGAHIVIEPIHWSDFHLPQWAKFDPEIVAYILTLHNEKLDKAARPMRKPEDK